MFETDPGPHIKWDGAAGPSDWRYHISEAQRAEWPNFAPEVRLHMARLAEASASHGEVQSGMTDDDKAKLPPKVTA